MYLVIGTGTTAWAQIEPTERDVLEGQVEQVLETKVILSEDGTDILYQKLEVVITKGPAKDQKIIIETGQQATVYQPSYAPGDRVLVSYVQDETGMRTYYITDYVRHTPLIWLVGIFVMLSLVIGRGHGIRSLLGLAFSFGVLGWFILPLISQGHSPVVIALLGAMIIAPVTFYLSHGINRKTSVAIVSTTVSLLITGLLGTYFIEAAHLTGFASDEALFLDIARQGSLNIRGLLLAGFIIGALGILDDITISQAAIVQELKQAKPTIGSKELFSRAMNVGRDHIASLINTLILVYTGSALPLLLLFLDNDAAFSSIINYEIVAEEIVRTLVGSIGLIIAVPLTTFIATRFAGYLAVEKEPTGHIHR
jgi:uncharacterized membrane protein